MTAPIGVPPSQDDQRASQVHNLRDALETAVAIAREAGDLLSEGFC